MNTPDRSIRRFTWTPAMTTGPAGKHSTSGACSARSRTAANPLPSRSASDGWSSGPTPGSTTSADSVAAPNAARPASTPTSPWPPPSSPSVHCGGPHGSSTAGTPGQDHRASADLLADALSASVSNTDQPLALQQDALTLPVAGLSAHSRGVG